ncbi:MAG: hypothetical protein ABW123_20705 [Cystobacter sp.]
MSMRAIPPALATVLLAAGCVSTTTLQPLPSAPTTASGTPVAQELGIRLVADGAAWKGNPADLGRIVTPVEIRVENHGERPLRIDTADFTLVGTSRFEYAALSRAQLQQENSAGVGGSGGWPDDGTVAPPMNLGRRGWRGGLGWGPGVYGPGWFSPFYDPFYGPYMSWYQPEPLPTRDMERKALPQGTLNPGGSLTGFVYFQGVSEREGQVTLRARLVDARTGEQFGTLDIPFEVKG